MTHEYTILVGGTILPGPDRPSCAAIAWAEGTVLALGTEAQIRALSRGDSEVFDLRGAFVVPLGAEDAVAWPAPALLEIGGPADLAILAADPRDRPRAPEAAILVRGGHAVHGSLPERMGSP